MSAKSIFLPDEAASLRFATWLAPRLQAGDIVALEGALGAGKTSLARGIIRALCGLETPVPSPTFTLVQHYEAPQFDIYHADLYRIENPDEVDELGLFEDDESVVLLEWAERLKEGGRSPQAVPNLRLRLTNEVAGATASDAAGRRLHFDDSASNHLTGWENFVAREKSMDRFLHNNNMQNATRLAIAGDASGRRYERLCLPDRAPVLLMDWAQKISPPKIEPQKIPPPKIEPQKTPPQDYAAQVKLGRQTGDYVKVADFLNACGISAPRCFGEDEPHGFLLIEDFGAQPLTKFIDEKDSRLDIFYHEAIAALALLHRHPPKKTLNLAAYDAPIWHTELDVFLDWYLPFIEVTLGDEEALKNWRDIWQTLFASLGAGLPDVLVLRDYHAPNLHWLESRQAARRVGVIDVQDALIGSPIYDVVSLLQDARRDVPPERAQKLLDFYLAQTGFERGAVELAFAIFGAQRNLRIMGVFARLALQDARPNYLTHIPRVQFYVAQNCQHPALTDLRNWLATYAPQIMDAPQVKESPR